MSIIENDVSGICYICGRTGHTDLHHMMHGTANRRLADMEDLTVHLCRGCHTMVHEQPWTGYDEMLKQTAQAAFEKYHSRNEWLRMFGKNYLDSEPCSKSGHK